MTYKLQKFSSKILWCQLKVKHFQFYIYYYKNYVRKHFNLCDEMKFYMLIKTIFFKTFYWNGTFCMLIRKNFTYVIVWFVFFFEGFYLDSLLIYIYIYI